jgi:hypothetical protein
MRHERGAQATAGSGDDNGTARTSAVFVGCRVRGVKHGKKSNAVEVKRGTYIYICKHTYSVWR